MPMNAFSKLLSRLYSSFCINPIIFCKNSIFSCLDGFNDEKISPYKRNQSSRNNPKSPSSCTFSCPSIIILEQISISLSNSLSQEFLFLFIPSSIVSNWDIKSLTSSKSTKSDKRLLIFETISFLSITTSDFSSGCLLRNSVSSPISSSLLFLLRISFIDSFFCSFASFNSLLYLPLIDSHFSNSAAACLQLKSHGQEHSQIISPSESIATETL